MTLPATMANFSSLSLAGEAMHFVQHERGTAEGCLCPVCGAHNKVKKYKLMRQHFGILDVLMRHGVGVAVHCRDFTGDGQAYNKMLNIPRHYGFINQQGQNPENPFDRSGEWAITPRGVEFAQNALRVPSHFWGLHDRVLWWAGDLCSRSEMDVARRPETAKTLIEEMSNAVLASDWRRGGWHSVPNRTSDSPV